MAHPCLVNILWAPVACSLPPGVRWREEKEIEIAAAQRADLRAGLAASAGIKLDCTYTMELHFPSALICSQLTEARGKLEVAAAERADLRADLAAVRESKLVADREARSAGARSTHLERELAFYQSQSASAMVEITSAGTIRWT